MTKNGKQPTARGLDHLRARPIGCELLAPTSFLPGAALPGREDVIGTLGPLSSIPRLILSA